LIGYCEDGQLHISNALAENAIRPFAVGRRYPQFAVMEGFRAQFPQDHCFSRFTGILLH
jgi:hypothetical protein